MRDYTYEGKGPTAAEREARRAFKEADVKVAMAEYERTQKAFHANHERLKAERLARDAEAAQKLKTGFRSNLSSSSNLLG